MKLSKKLAIGALSTIFTGLAGTGYYQLNYNYAFSKGTTGGIQQKISEEGWVFKTYEGNLTTAGPREYHGAPEAGLTSNFRYSVRDKAVFEKLAELENKAVIVTYKEVRSPLFFKNTTRYIITDAKRDTHPDFGPLVPYMGRK